MNWSPETEALGRRYFVLYGTSQTLWVSAVLAAIAEALDVGGLATWGGFFLLAVGGSVAWRRAWLKYRAAFMAETDFEIETLKREYKRFLQ